MDKDMFELVRNYRQLANDEMLAYADISKCEGALEKARSQAVSLHMERMQALRDLNEAAGNGPVESEGWIDAFPLTELDNNWKERANTDEENPKKPTRGRKAAAAPKD